MAQPKTHFKDTNVGAVCGRVKGRMTDNVRYVDCLRCKDQPEWQEAYRLAMEAREAAFHAQEPHQVRHLMNYAEPMRCRECDGDLFRERERSLFSFHYVCAACGTSVHPPTETGLCT